MGCRFETRSACYRGPKPQKCSKKLGEGANGILAHVDQKPVALVQERVALVQNTVASVQETLRDHLQLVKTPSARTPVAGAPGLKCSFRAAFSYVKSDAPKNHTNFPIRNSFARCYVALLRGAGVDRPSEIASGGLFWNTIVCFDVIVRRPSYYRRYNHLVVENPRTSLKRGSRWKCLNKGGNNYGQ